MIVIRLTRVGKKKQPSYRMVVQEKGRDPWGKAFEIVGTYHPRTKQLLLKEDRIKDWLSKGAQASPTVHNLLVDKKLITGEKHRATMHDKPAKKAEEKKAEAAKPEEKKA